jgi:hypothetical protein
MMTLQRYRINNCADIADDNGGYCLSEDVKALEANIPNRADIEKPVKRNMSDDDWAILEKIVELQYLVSSVIKKVNSSDGGRLMPLVGDVQLIRYIFTKEDADSI